MKLFIDECIHQWRKKTVPKPPWGAEPNDSLEVFDHEHAVFISVHAIQATEERNPPAQHVPQYQILEKLCAVIHVRIRATYATSESWLTALRAAILKSS